jgi:hypothetical protein
MRSSWIRPTGLDDSWRMLTTLALALAASVWRLCWRADYWIVKALAG